MSQKEAQCTFNHKDKVSRSEAIQEKNSPLMQRAVGEASNQHRPTYFNHQPEVVPQGFHRATNFTGGQLQHGIAVDWTPPVDHGCGQQATLPHQLPLAQQPPICQNRENEWMDAMTEFMKKQFGLKPKEQDFMYRQPYPDWFDQVPLPQRYRVPDFS